MMLPWLILSLLIGGGLAWACGRWRHDLPRWIALATLALHLAVLLATWWRYLNRIEVSGGPWLVEFDAAWISQFGIRFHLGMDGLSLLLIVLADFLGVMAITASWKEIQTNVGLFHFNLLWMFAALVGVFLALDLFLFYVFWELMLVPLYFLIAIWGHENRVYAAIKFFLFTQASSLLMLLGILGLYFVHGAGTGQYTFDYEELLGTAMSSTTAFWLMLGFFAAMAVKLPMVPLHTWLPDAHTEAPTAGSVALAGLVLKVGAYGLLRFLVPLFPESAIRAAPLAMILGVAGILYGAVEAFGQTDVKRLVAYTSVSHMGFVLLGIFAWNDLALQGTLLVMIAHGVSTGALFILVGALQHRLGTRQLDRMGGLWAATPRLGGAAMVFAMASLGLPGLGNFVGEFLVLLGAYQANPAIAAAATLGFVVSTAYSLRMIQCVFFGPERGGEKPPDSTPRESAMMASMIAVIVWLGLFPQPVLRTGDHALSTLQRFAASGRNSASSTAPTATAAGGLTVEVPRKTRGNGP
jgi:NADH-quinone oxidoreductase subunit M